MSETTTRGEQANTLRATGLSWRDVGAKMGGASAESAASAAYRWRKRPADARPPGRPRLPPKKKRTNLVWLHITKGEYTGLIAARLPKEKPGTTARRVLFQGDDDSEAGTKTPPGVLEKYVRMWLTDGEYAGLLKARLTGETPSTAARRLLFGGEEASGAN